MIIVWKSIIKYPFGFSWKWRSRFAFSVFFFFPCAWTVKSHDFTVQGTKNIVHTLFIYCSCTVHRSHNTIHTFKNYFVTVFSVFSFSNNKFNPNRPLVVLFCNPQTKKLVFLFYIHNFYLIIYFISG